jgi:hypothetical protein
MVHVKGLDGTVVDFEIETGWNWTATMTGRPDLERVCTRVPLGGTSTISVIVLISYSTTSFIEHVLADSVPATKAEPAPIQKRTGRFTSNILTPINSQLTHLTEPRE